MPANLFSLFPSDLQLVWGTFLFWQLGNLIRYPGVLIKWLLWLQDILRIIICEDLGPMFPLHVQFLTV